MEAIPVCLKRSARRLIVTFFSQEIRLCIRHISCQVDSIFVHIYVWQGWFTEVDLVKISLVHRFIVQVSYFEQWLAHILQFCCMAGFPHHDIRFCPWARDIIRSTAVMWIWISWKEIRPELLVWISIMERQMLMETKSQNFLWLEDIKTLLIYRSKFSAASLELECTTLQHSVRSRQHFDLAVQNCELLPVINTCGIPSWLKRFFKTWAISGIVSLLVSNTSDHLE